MNNIKSLLAGIICVLTVFQAMGQPKKYTTANGHAHNDYLNAQPFITAFENGFGSIEVDVFPVDGKLMVAHDKNKIEPARTIEHMYLHLLSEKLKMETLHPVRLLVDIKDDYKASLDILIRNLSTLRNHLSVPGKRGMITVLISGKRPPPSEYNEYPAYIFFDDDLKLAHDSAAWTRVGQVSLQFSRFSTWRGTGPVMKDERNRLQQVIDSVHHAGKTIRFWGVPDNPRSWELQLSLGADLIGTDRIEALAAYLRKASMHSSKSFTIDP